MLRFVLLIALGLGCFSSPVEQKLPKQQEKPQEPSASQQTHTQNISFGYAVDLFTPTSLMTFRCMKQNGYQTVFIRAYSPIGQGQPDPFAVTSIQNAYASDLGTEVYMTPQPNSAKSGAQQLEELYTNLVNAGIAVRGVWIQVTSPINWFSSIQSNIYFIKNIIDKANAYKLAVGIYTNYYEWNQITGSTSVRNMLLWYWNVYGSGSNSESSPDFSDFRAFGGWTAPTVKQYGQVEFVCDAEVNRDIYYVNASTVNPIYTVSAEKPQQISVGGLLLANSAFKENPEIEL